MKLDKTKEFILKARKVHGDLYDYSYTEYVSARDKLVIACEKHGEFVQEPSDHLKGRGCRSCGFERVTTADFIKNARKVHGKKYDYSKSEFIKSIQPTTVTCRIHGDFQITPNVHQNGGGCPICSKLNRGKLKAAIAAGKFEEKARAVHGDAIDYSKTRYVTAKTKAIFICVTHGEWSARPDNILHGKGCPECKRQKVVGMNNELAKKAGKEFPAKASIVHNDKYDYSKVAYITVHKKVEIVCPDHGSFLQSPANHISGENGCPDCSIFGFRTSKPGWLYLQTLSDKYIKIGITNHTPERRLREIKKNSKLAHKIVGKWLFKDGNDALIIETKIKQSFECGVLSRDVLEDGFSETMHISELAEVLKLIKAMERKINAVK